MCSVFGPMYTVYKCNTHEIISIGARAILCESDPSLEFGPDLHASPQLINKTRGGRENQIKKFKKSVGKKDQKGTFFTKHFTSILGILGIAILNHIFLTLIPLRSLIGLEYFSVTNNLVWKIGAFQTVLNFVSSHFYTKCSLWKCFTVDFGFLIKVFWILSGGTNKGWGWVGWDTLEKVWNEIWQTWSDYEMPRRGQFRSLFCNLTIAGGSLQYHSQLNRRNAEVQNRKGTEGSLRKAEEGESTKKIMRAQMHEDCIPFELLLKLDVVQLCETLMIMLSH